MLTNDERDALRALARMKVANGSAFAPDVVLALLDALDAETARADYERGQADFWRNRAEDRETAQRASIGRLTRERDEARAEVERLLALVSAKESWIDGAKVDLDGYDEARAVIARVRELHQQYRPAHRDDTDICTECSQYPVDVPWPCATIRALDGAS